MIGGEPIVIKKDDGFTISFNFEVSSTEFVAMTTGTEKGGALNIKEILTLESKNINNTNVFIGGGSETLSLSFDIYQTKDMFLLNKQNLFWSPQNNIAFMADNKTIIMGSKMQQSFNTRIEYIGGHSQIFSGNFNRFKN